jgi:hypothetical protein
MPTVMQIVIGLWLAVVIFLGYFVNSSIRIQYRLWRDAGAFDLPDQDARPPLVGAARD